MATMPVRTVFKHINPLASAAGMGIAGILLVTTIFFTVFELPWVAFLSGILCAAAVGLVSRLAYAETALAEVREDVRYVGDELPMMIVYVSADGTICYHNQAFRYWLRGRRERINERQLRDVVGLTIYAQLKSGIDAALNGRATCETRCHEGLGNVESRLLTQYLPHVGEVSAIVGAFLVQTDVTSSEDSFSPPEFTATSPATIDGMHQVPVTEDAGNARRIFVNTMTEELTDWKNAGDRLRAALDNDEFLLYCQAIEPVAEFVTRTPFFEVLLRLREEEEGLMPPGAFLPLAEEYGLLPALDRWVVTHVLDWAVANLKGVEATYCLNVSAPTIANSEFPDFVTGELKARGVAGSTLCFEILESDARADRKGAVRLVSVLAQAGCKTTLCGFGQDAESYGFLKHMKVDYLKIDGGIVLGLARNPVDLIKLKAITRVARATGRRTIAEFVESDETIARLREQGVDFAQGFGVSRPRPLSELA